MAVSFLDFEQPIAELEAKIEELGHVTSDSKVNIAEEISRLQRKSRQLTTTIFASLTPWQITQLARHPQRDRVELVGPVKRDVDDTAPEAHPEELEVTAHRPSSA